MVTKQSVGLYLKEKVILRYTVVTGALVLLAVLWILLKLRSSGSLNPIHYNIFFGIDRVGPWYYLLRYPAAVLGVLALNFALGYFIFARDKYLSYYLLLMALLCSVATILFLLFLTSYAY